MSIKLAVFDLAGTTVDDLIKGIPLVTIAMIEAFGKEGFVVNNTQVNDVRGMEKREAISCISSKIATTHSAALVDKIFENFIFSLECNLQQINKEIEGTTEVFASLSSKGIKIGLGSGFPQAVVEEIVKNLNWVKLVDFVSSAESIGKGRPDPGLILSAMEKFGISDNRQVIKIGDTRMDIEEGKNARCWTVAVLTGTQKQESLKEANPDFIIESVQDLPRIISQIEDMN